MWLLSEDNANNWVGKNKIYLKTKFPFKSNILSVSVGITFSAMLSVINEELHQASRSWCKRLIIIR